MSWMWTLGAALAAMCSVACGITLGARVAKGEARIWDLDVAGWAIGFHGTVGVAALMMLVAAKG